MTIHPTAIIDAKAQLDSSVVIGPYAVVMGKVSLAKGVEVGAFTHIRGKTSIGSGTVIDSHVSIGGDPQDKKTALSPSQLVIGENNRIREFVTINRGANTTSIGNDNWLMAYAHVAHDCTIGNRCTFSNGATLGGHVTVGDDVTFGGLCAIHQWCRIGNGAMIAGGSMVVQDVPPHCIAQGDRATLAGLNRIGLRRQNIDSEEIDALYAAYRAVFNTDDAFRKSIENGLSELKSETPDKIRQFWTFFEETKRGFCKGRHRQ